MSKFVRIRQDYIKILSNRAEWVGKGRNRLEPGGSRTEKVKVDQCWVIIGPNKSGLDENWLK